ncbi:MAG TPA: class I SAM-dependent methyltransferase [Chroococcales cyanobacterium]
MSTTCQDNMSTENACTSETYKENLEFWDRAWNAVKKPYTQMPDLQYLDTIVDYLKEKAAEHVLDLGCGSGWLAILLARNGFEVTGLDVATHAIELARMWADQETLSIQFDIGDIGDLNYPNGFFDAVVANSIFEHLNFALAERTLARIKNQLIPGGAFIGAFDNVGGGAGEYYELQDGSHIYTDKGRKGMLLRRYSTEELQQLFADWTITKLEELDNGTRLLCAHTKH